MISKQPKEDGSKHKETPIGPQKYEIEAPKTYTPKVKRQDNIELITKEPKDVDEAERSSASRMPKKVSSLVQNAMDNAASAGANLAIMQVQKQKSNEDFVRSLFQQQQSNQSVQSAQAVAKTIKEGLDLFANNKTQEAEKNALASLLNTIVQRLTPVPVAPPLSGVFAPPSTLQVGTSSSSGFITPANLKTGSASLRTARYKWALPTDPDFIAILNGKTFPTPPTSTATQQEFIDQLKVWFPPPLDQYDEEVLKAALYQAIKFHVLSYPIPIMLLVSIGKEDVIIFLNDVLGYDMITPLSPIKSPALSSIVSSAFAPSATGVSGASSSSIGPIPFPPLTGIPSSSGSSSSSSSSSSSATGSTNPSGASSASASASPAKFTMPPFDIDRTPFRVRTTIMTPEEEKYIMEELDSLDTNALTIVRDSSTGSRSVLMSGELEQAIQDLFQLGLVPNSLINSKGFLQKKITRAEMAQALLNLKKDIYQFATMRNGTKPLDPVAKPFFGTGIDSTPDLEGRVGTTALAGSSRGKKYFPFGSLNIDMEKLKGGIVSIGTFTKRNFKTKVGGMKNRMMSQDAIDKLHHILKNGTVPDMSKLPAEEREHILKIIELSGTQPQGVDSEEISSIRKARRSKNNISAIKKRFQLLMGEVAAGNKNNPMIIQELFRVMDRMERYGLLTKEAVLKYRALLIRGG